MDVLREVLLPKLEGVRMSGGSWMARCPVHEDAKASLHISRGKEQPVVLMCHAGCERDVILDALGLAWDDLCAPRDEQAPRGEWTPRGEAVAIYDYVDEAGKLLFQVLRTASKDFPQRIPDPSRKGGWCWRLGSTRRVLYRLPGVIEAVTAGEMIFVCEGERDVHSLEGAGVVATCNPGGAGPGKWLPEFSEALREAIVVVIADRDEPGRLHARRIADALRDIAAAAEIWEPASGKDATDHLNAGLTIRDFNKPSGDDGPRPDLDPDIHEFLAEEDPPEDWVIDGLLEHGERLVLTGIEGYGKSTMLRQFAVCAAAGIHPFTAKPAKGAIVLYVDCENTPRQSRKKFRQMLRIAAVQGHQIPPGGLRMIHKAEGIDLTRDDDAAWLMERVALYKPDLVIIGPLYRLHVADANEELTARRVAKVLDDARVSSGCALILEAHAGHANGGQKRSMRPIGSSLFLRWPEYGFGMDPKTGDAKNLFNFVPWRGGRDRDRGWPRQVIWASGIPGETGWPWQEFAPASRPRDNTGADWQLKDD